MANVSKLIFGVAIATVTIATPALATHRGFLLIRMDMSHEAAKDVAFIILSRPRLLQKTSVTLSPGLVIQHRDRMFIFQAWPRVVNDCDVKMVAITLNPYAASWDNRDQRARSDH